MNDDIILTVLSDLEGHSGKSWECLIQAKILEDRLQICISVGIPGALALEAGLLGDLSRRSASKERMNGGISRPYRPPKGSNPQTGTLSQSRFVV